jgi:hypothetical protein
MTLGATSDRSLLAAYVVSAPTRLFHLTIVSLPLATSIGSVRITFLGGRRAPEELCIPSGRSAIAEVYSRMWSGSFARGYRAPLTSKTKEGQSP